MAIKPKKPAPDDDEMIVIDFDDNESGHLWNNRSNIFIATPMYGGMCSGYYTQGVLGLIGVLSGMGHSSATRFIFNE
jgi:hypothetical protein